MMKCPLTLCVFIILIFWISNGVESLPHHQQDNHHDHHDHAETRKLSKNKPLDFAMHLLDNLHHEAAMDENIIMSPLSIFTALFVTCSGAAGKTREELGKYLSISANEEESKKQLSSKAESLKQILLKKDPSFVESSLAVGLFIQKDFPIHPEFIKAAKTQFSAHVANVDFSENGATNGINKFISDATKNRIPSLFESPLDSQTQVVLVNALYFQGIWKESFVAANTKLMQSLHENISSTVNAVKNVEKGTIHSVNGMFVEKLIPLKDTFLANVRKYYRSDVVHVDFENGGYAATNYINKWISEETKNRIPKLFEEPFSSSTKAVIASSVYFSANWAHPFKDYMTQDDKFNTGFNEIDIATMRNKKEVRYVDYEAASFEAVALPYDGDEFFMYFLLPYGNQTVKNLTNDLTIGDLRTMMSSMNDSFVYVDYKIPKTKLRLSTTMSEHLKKMGVRKIFENATFGNMIATTHLKISEVTQAAEIENDEKGTVASGVTTLEYEVYSEYVPLAEPVKFYVDKPFLFFITHVKTSIPIFFGLVHNPAG